jgi:hypothetical protein
MTQIHQQRSRRDQTPIAPVFRAAPAKPIRISPIV